MTLHEQTKIKADKTGRRDRTQGLPCRPEKYGAVKGSAWYEWYTAGYHAGTALVVGDEG